MLRLPALLLALAAAPASALYDDAFLALPTFDVPALDYAALERGDAPGRLLDLLQADGIVALRNVPSLARVRAKYLEKAAECALLAADSAEAGFLSTKLFGDGTRRHTINTNAGLELDSAALNTQELCPGYRELYLQFSEVLERTVNTFGRALDETSFTVSDGERTISARQLVGEAVRLDHFHAYEAAKGMQQKTESQRKLEFSLPVHEDHGLFIAMTAPKFFDVDEGGRRLVERHLSNDASGLVIQTSNGQRVRPVLKDDEVVIMMGTGGSRWLQTSHKIPAVMHGMKMPDSVVNSPGRSLRAWFGKMTLLPAYQRLLENRDVTFDEHVNMTTRFLLEHDDDDLKTIGCATGRMLTASEGSCTYKTCSTKSGATAPSEGCQTICNRSGHSATDATDCAAKCTCQDSASGEICWMLCVAVLDSCDVAAQTCNSQSLVCSSTPAPTTTAPAATTKAPTTTAPPATTTAPAPATTTSSPSTNAPASSSSPSTTAPSAASPSGASTASSSTNTSPTSTTAAPTSSSTGTSSPAASGGASAGSTGTTGSTYSVTAEAIAASAASAASGSSSVSGDEVGDVTPSTGSDATVGADDQTASSSSGSAGSTLASSAASVPSTPLGLVTGALASVVVAMLL